MENLDDIIINFDSSKLFWVNAVLSLVMYAVALEIRLADFKAVFRQPRMVLAGFSSQFLMLPLITLLVVAVLPMHPSVALGLFLIAACPGGNVSNFFSLMAKGNIEPTTPTAPIELIDTTKPANTFKVMCPASILANKRTE